MMNKRRLGWIGVGLCACALSSFLAVSLYMRPYRDLIKLTEAVEVLRENCIYVEEDWEGACKRSIEILFNEGVGHTMTIHSQDKSVIREFALKKPVSRLLVNTPGALGGVGATTGLPPALTLGCGAVGGSATSDNVGPMNLINIRRVAYGLRELEDLRGTPGTCRGAEKKEACTSNLSREEIEAITRAVLARLNAV